MKLAFSKTINLLYVTAGNIRSAVAELFVMPPVLAYGTIALILNLVTWFLAAALQRSIGNELAVLHYNVTFGIDRIGEAVSLYVLPLTGFGLLLLNLLLSGFARQKSDRLMLHILLAMAVLGNGVILVSLYTIYLINFS